MASTSEDAAAQDQALVGHDPVSLAERVAAPRHHDSVNAPLVDYVLRLGDDALILSQRLVDWVAKSPAIEEDIALANIALDLLGQARMLLTYAGSLMPEPQSEDDLAYWRQSSQLRSAHLVEIPGGDFAQTMARQLVFSTYQQLLYGQLAASTDATIAAIAAKASKEVRYHVDHATQWVLRLGDGTTESHERMQTGIDTIWPYTAELFDADAGVVPFATAPIDQALWPLIESGVCPDPMTLQPMWRDAVVAVLETATLTIPETRWHARGGRRGEHTADLDYVLAEMQSVARAHPGASW